MRARSSMGSGLCLDFDLDPVTRHYPDRDAKKRLNNSSSMPEFIRGCESAPCGLPDTPAGRAQPPCQLIAPTHPRMDDRTMAGQNADAERGSSQQDTLQDTGQEAVQETARDS